MANRWLEKYPEQAHFNFITISDWLENIVEKPLRILEIGGWRGDLALKALSSFKEIELWHNYDLLEDSAYQKCKDTRYKLITLDDYIWNKSMVYNYNALIATHMIEHISWNELSSLIMWIPAGISSVLFEAPLSEDAEDYSWKGNHSSHILEKGWAQVSGEMLKAGFQVLNKEENTMMFSR